MMKIFILASIVVLAVAAGPTQGQAPPAASEQSFMLKSELTGKVYGPFELVDGEKLSLDAFVFTVVLKDAESATSPQSQAETPATGTMSYSVLGNDVTVHNTPWGEKSFTMTFPPGATGGTGSIFVDGAPRIKISYTRQGVQWVSVDGVMISERE